MYYYHYCYVGSKTCLFGTDPSVNHIVMFIYLENEVQN